jgi:hypothetical protein
MVGRGALARIPAIPEPDLVDPLAGAAPSLPTSQLGPAQGTMWVQPPNHGGAGRLAPDFFEMFTTRIEEWVEARRFVGVWVVRATSLRGADAPVTDAFLRDAFLPQLNRWAIELAVNVTGATLAECGDPAARLAGEAALIQRLLDLGARVTYLSLQSPLSKVGRRECPAYGRETGYDLRIADVVRYVAYMTGRFPGIRVGLVDAMPAKGWAYRDVYRRLADTLAGQGLGLDFLHLDFPMEAAAPGWANLREVEEFVRGELGVRFGVLYVSRVGGETSNVAFRDNVLEAYRSFRAAGGRPDHLELTSWYPYPNAILSEDDAVSAPFMNLARDFARLGGVAPRVEPDLPPASTPVAKTG